MKHYRVLDSFFQTRWGKPNAPTTPTFITISQILPILRISTRWLQFSRKSEAYCTEMCYTSSNVSLIFSKTINRKKNGYDKKYVSRWGLQIIFRIFCEVLHIGWDKRQKPWFSWFSPWKSASRQFSLLKHCPLLYH